MAVDEMLFIRCQEKKNFPPVLRIYDWSEPAISIGYFQEVHQALNVQKAQQERVSIVRRITGGRAVLHFGELTYAVVGNGFRDRVLGTDLRSTYQEISLALGRALQKLGIRAEYKRGRPARREDRLSYTHPCFESVSAYELTVQGKKIAGSAQRRSKGCFIQQGSLPRENTQWRISDYLPNRQNSSGSGLHSWDERGTSLSRAVGRKVDLIELKEPFKQGFEEHFGISFIEEGLTQAEIYSAFQLEREKYARPEWNLGHNRGNLTLKSFPCREQLVYACG
jgi:lipoate-protein ligase A